MLNEYSFEINKRKYLLKRLFHKDLPLTYHVHYFSGFKNVILRMGIKNGKWGFLNTMNIHFRFEDLQFHLATEIRDNEKRIEDTQIAALAKFALN